jgi:phosphate transport system permease protein
MTTRPREAQRSQIAETVSRGLKARYRQEARFRAYGIIAIVLALGMLVALFVDIIGKGHTAFLQTHVDLTLTVSADSLGVDPATMTESDLARANFQGVIKDSLQAMFPEAAADRRQRRQLYGLISDGAGYQLRDLLVEDPSLIGQEITLSVPFSADIDMLAKGHINRDAPEAERRVNDLQVGWFDQLVAEGRVESRFNTALFTNGDSRQPELAGIWGGVVGSFYTLLVTLALSFPIGVAAAVYLEEFAPQNKWTDLIEVNINNLAAVPSIVFGLLGLAVFLQFFGLPRSAPVVGGLVLTLMTLPTIIIASRAALKSVPPSIREAALGLGASKLQMIFHHVLPLAMPGMLTGTIIGMAQALGESAPLLMIGMVAFVVDIPGGPLDPATVLPVQIFLWADSPERAFVERTSAAIMVLLAFLVFMNAAAVMLRKKFERRW